MANALFVDALKGYEFYLSRKGNVSIDQVNAYLDEQGRNQIALRTYTHYSKLLEHGFRSYIPINKFDVFQSIGKIQLAADRRRYHREPTNIPAEISRDKKNWHQALIIDRSIVGFGIITEKRFPTSTSVSGWVRIDGYYEIPVVIVWRQHDEEATRLGVRAMEFVAKYRIQPEELEKVGSMRILRVRRKSKDGLEWNNVYGTLERINELIQSAADLMYTFEDVYGVPVYIRSSAVKSIAFGSPGDIQVKVDLGIAEVIRTVLDMVQFGGLQKRKLRAEIEAQELDNEAKNLANENLKLEIIRNAVKTSKAIQETSLVEPIVNDLKKLIPDILDAKDALKESFSPGSPELGILAERILPASVDLTAGDDADYEAEVTDEEDEDNSKGQDSSGSNT
jgi:hypothetical protein